MSTLYGPSVSLNPKLRHQPPNKNHPELLNLYSRAAEAAAGHKAKMLVGPVIFKVRESMIRSTWLRKA